MRSYLFLLVLFIPFFAFSDTKTDSLFDQLNRELNNKKNYDHQKEAAIQKLKESLKTTAPNNLQVQFNICTKLYDEYKSYQYDSAYVYAIKMQDLSHLLKDKSKYDYSKIKIGFILISSGMFKETFDNLKGINVQSLNDSVKLEYYSLLTRAYYDLASYDNDKHYMVYYNSLANKYIDSAIALSKPGSYDNIYLTGYKKLKNGGVQESAADFITLLNKHQLTLHQYAIVASTLSNIYANTKNHQERIDLLIKATIADIKTSTKETVALFWLA
ncbi:MAG: hypothetical protein JWR67_2301, partial [Mucilaginibacter sp.]|nr:hypothetical protein [Mucilaginibacter sp.]